MSYAQKLAGLHSRCIAKFGINAADARLFCWHGGKKIACYQTSGTRTRDVLARALTKEESITIHATKADFTARPKPGDDILLGTVQASADKYRVVSVATTFLRPFYELELMDPNLAATAPSP